MTDTAQSTGGDSANRTILINFVLDRSGSMMGARDATISGFNEFKNDQTSEEGDAFFTLTLFDTRFDTVAAADSESGNLDIFSDLHATLPAEMR